MHASFSAAPALAVIDTANIAFAPSSACKIMHAYYFQINESRDVLFLDTMKMYDVL